MGNPIHSMQASTESPCPTPSGSATDAPRTARMALNELIDKKQQVEEELSALGNVLDSVRSRRDSERIRLTHDPQAWSDDGYQSLNVGWLS